MLSGHSFFFFFERTAIYQSLIFITHICGSVSWHKQRNFFPRIRVVDGHQAEKRFTKPWVWSPSIHSQMNRFRVIKILYRCGETTKITPGARCVPGEPSGTSKKLKASLLLTDVNVHEENPEQWRKTLLSKKNIAVCLQFVKDHMDKSEGPWK